MSFISTHDGQQKPNLRRTIRALSRLGKLLEILCLEVLPRPGAIAFIFGLLGDIVSNSVSIGLVISEC